MLLTDKQMNRKTEKKYFLIQLVSEPRGCTMNINIYRHTDEEENKLANKGQSDKQTKVILFLLYIYERGWRLLDW